MKILDVIRDPATASIRDEVCSFTASILGEYLTEVNQLKKTPGFIEGKDVHDAVWGPITLNPGEVLIIDSPLIQRLRRIHHLGLAGLLFPGADYSRFDHTLGTLHIADKIVGKLANEQHFRPTSENDRKYLSPIQIARLAAIFHDCGHTICSHASERFFESPYYSRFKEVRRIKDHFIKRTNLTSAKLSEILSLFILTSPAVQNLIELAWLFFDLPSPKNGFDEILGHIAGMIIGVQINFKMLPFYSCISGSIDADKCDYLARDSYRTGVPVAVDLYRVIQKLKLVKMVPNLFGGVWEEHSGSSSEDSFLLGIALSAVKSVEEILFSRTLMHEKIYYHHKILASEEMLRKALLLLDQCGFPHIKSFQYILALTDHDVITNYPDVFLPALACKEELRLDFAEKTEFGDACKLLKFLTLRKLLKRCLAISTGIENAALIPTPESDEVNSFITDVFTDIEVKRHSAFVDYIIAETANVLSVLDSTYEEEDIRIGILVVPSPQMISSDFNIPLEYGGKTVYYREFFQGESWDNSRKSSHAVHFVIGPAHLRSEVFLATEKVLFKKYGFLIGEGCLELSKLNRGHIYKLREKLINKGYYSDAIEIMPDKLTFSSDMLQNLCPSCV